MRDITLGDTIYFLFTTRDFDTGAPQTLGGTPALSVYEENNLTQITAGVSISADYDSVTGLNQGTIVATSGNGYESGKSYSVVITTGTVDGVSVVGEVVYEFTVEASAAFDRLGAPAGASVSADIATIDGNVDAILVDTAEIGTAGAGLTNIPWNASWDAEVQSEVNDGLVAYSAVATTDLPTNFGDLAITVTTGQVTVGTNNDKTGYSISGTLTTLDALDTAQDSQHTTTQNAISALNDISAADVNAQCDTALSDIGLQYLVNTALPTNWATDVTANSALDYIVDDGTAAYDRTTDSLQAIRDRGDAAWTTGGGGSISDILNVQPMIPNDIDLANTATVRIGLMLTNALDDLPSTAEITPGTIDIDRKAIGGTSWTSVVSGAACSESAGQIYYDEVFDSGTGYAEGDSIRITFKSQKITVAANDYEITDATGVMFQTSIRQTMRGTDSAATASALATAQADLDTITGSDGVTLATTQSNYAPSVAGDAMTLANNSITSSVVATNALTNTAFATSYYDAAADAVWDEATAGHVSAGTTGAALTDVLADTNEIQGDWVNGGRLDLLLDAIKAVTDNIPASGALNNLSAADVNAQVLDVLNTDTFAEISSIPAATTTLTNMIRLLYSLARNKTMQTATTFTLRNDADSGNIGTATVSDDGTTGTKGKLS